MYTFIHAHIRIIGVGTSIIPGYKRARAYASIPRARPVSGDQKSSTVECGFRGGGYGRAVVYLVF